MVTCANMCARHARILDAYGATTPYRGSCQLDPTTAVLPHAQATYRKRFRAAYAPHPSRAVTPCRPSTTKSSTSRIDPHRGLGLPVTVTTATGRRHQNLVDSSIVRTNAPSCADIDSPRGPVPHIVGCESHIRQPSARVCKLHTSNPTAVLKDTVTYQLKHNVSRTMKNASLIDPAESAPQTRRYLRQAIRPCRAISLATSHRQPQFPGDATCADNK